MLLINPKYRGRYHKWASDLVRAGSRVGMMWLEKREPHKVHCHICDKDFESPEVCLENGDAKGECPHCKSPFVFALALATKVEA